MTGGGRHDAGDGLASRSASPGRLAPVIAHRRSDRDETPPVTSSEVTSPNVTSSDSTSSDPTSSDPGPYVHTPKDPDELSGHLAQEAVRRVHAQSGVPADAPLNAHSDPKVPGAHFVDGYSDARFWVGLQGEVVRTGNDDVPAAVSPTFQRAHRRYTAAVEAVRLRYSTPVVQDLFAVPDTHVPTAFFVYDTQRPQTVRWVDPEGTVFDGYVLVDGAAHWDEATAGARRAVLRSQPSTAALLDDPGSR